eukprot:scaffold169819_cov32-Tisochrysis_lutea.AAC.2
MEHEHAVAEHLSGGLAIVMRLFELAQGTGFRCSLSEARQGSSSGVELLDSLEAQVNSCSTVPFCDLASLSLVLPSTQSPTAGRASHLRGQLPSRMSSTG